MGTQRVLYFFTATYPFGLGESFITPELNIISSKFDKVYIFSKDSEGQAREIPANCEVVKTNFSNKNSKMRLLFTCLPIFITELFSSRKKWIFVKNSRYYFSLLKQAYKMAMCVESKIRDDKSEKSFYSFWGEQWATSLGILKNKKVIGEFIFRLHGYDMFEERWKDEIIPFRNFQLKKARAVICASKNGQEYMRKKYDVYQHKIGLSYLGMANTKINPWNNSDTYTIVSCSWCIEIKRVHKIAEALAKIKNVKIKWVHFGGGPTESEILRLAKLFPPEIKLDLKGNVSSKEIMDFYSLNSIDLMIHLSETEGGVPLALQEAVSFGIPVLACNAGGVQEIINEFTGIIIPIDSSADEISDKLVYLLHNKFNNKIIRREIKSYWEQNFDMNNSYNLFFEKYLNQKEPKKAT